MGVSRLADAVCRRLFQPKLPIEEVRMGRPERNLNRRQFIGQSVRSTGVCALGGVTLALSVSSASGVQKDTRANPFAYDVERLAKIDPKIVGYEQVGVISGLNPEPRRIAVGPADTLYVATKNGVEMLNSQGLKLAEIVTISPARCVAVAVDGTIYAGLRDHIEVFNAKGQRRAAWESPTRKTWFTGLSVGGNDVFAADSANRVVLRYDRSGKLIGRLGEKSQERNIPGLIVPSPYLDVKLGADGLLRVNNPGRHCVEVFTLAGDLEFSWGKPSAAIEGFCGCCNPIGLALLPDGSCITCEKGLPRVKVYSADRNFDCVVAGPEVFRDNSRAGLVSEVSDGTLGGLDAAVDSQGRIYVLDLVAANVRVMKRKV
jgi:hypothetical protein